MKLIKKFKDYFKPNPKNFYSALNLGKSEIEEFFFPTIEVLDNHMIKASVHTTEDNEQVHCISIECIVDIDRYEDIIKIAKQNIKRFNSYYKDKGLVADARVVNYKEKGTLPVPDDAQEMIDIYKDLKGIFNSSVSFYISLYNPLDYANSSARKRGIKEKPTHGYNFFIDYL